MITTVISFSEATACAFVLAAVLIQIRRSDRQPNGRHIQPPGHTSEKLAQTADIPMGDVEWFRSLKDPRKPAPAFDLTRDVVPPPEYDPEYAPAPKYPPAWRPIRREQLDPPSLKTSGPAMPDETPGSGPVAGPEPKRPVPAVPDSAVSTAGTGLPPGEIAPWVLDTLRGTDSILDSICAKAGAL